MEPPVDILALAECNDLDPAHFLEWCESVGPSPMAVTDSLATRIALDYLAGKLDDVFCDRVMNSIINVVTSAAFLAASDRCVPELTTQIYLAFDAGEYLHAEDQPHDSPEIKYTLPMLKALLAGSDIAS